MTANLVKNITQISDLEEPIQLINRVIGETCWKVCLSYADELTLHIGAKIPYLQKSMLGKEKGEWILGTQATYWQLECQSQTIVSSDDNPEIIKQRINVIENNTIANTEINYQNLALTVDFSNECRLILLPNIASDVELPYWEMFTPYQMVLKFGPSAVWSYISSNIRTDMKS
ncbi:MAG: hypothetical protein HC908_06730 [Calothrix sp. SM1_7_51]|nr:hypothetical protein [Calothrix sp. SM1_7_51]